MQFANTNYSLAQAQSIYYVTGFPRSSLLAPAQPMEWLDFNGDLPCKQCNRLAFVTDKDGWVDGVHLHLYVQVDGAPMPMTKPPGWPCVSYMRTSQTLGSPWLPNVLFARFCPRSIGEHRRVLAAHHVVLRLCALGRRQPRCLAAAWLAR